MAKLLVIHGPNLNLLGTREPEKYGSTALDEINSRLQAQAKAQHHTLKCFQSNAEHQLIDAIHAAQNDHIDYIILNAGAFTHTSIALRDALAAVNIPFIEVHLSNVYAREEFRHYSYFSDLAAGVIVGLGPMGYELALQAILQNLQKAK